jgi:hemolysin activation/secretion protein
MDGGANSFGWGRSYARCVWLEVGRAVCRALMLSLFFALPNVRAQTAPDDEAQQRRAQERTDAQRSRLEAPVDVRSKPALADTRLIDAQDQPCFVIGHIALEFPDSVGLSAAARADLLAATSGPNRSDSPIGRCLGSKGVALVLERVQQHILNKGWVTTRVLAQQQDISSGTLTLSVLPGYLRAIRVDTATPPRVSAATAIPARVGEVLNLRDIEQGLENLKRVPTADVSMQVTPATEPGAQSQSDLVLVHRQGFPARLSLTVDDSGSKSTGKLQGSGTFSLDNPLGLSDLFYITRSQDLGGGDSGARGTRGTTVHYSVPFGYWLLGATHSSNRYFQEVAGREQSYVYSGTSENSELKLARVVYRDALRKTQLSIKGWQRKSNSYLEDTEIDVQRRVVGGWELALNHKDAVGATTLETTLAYKRGTKDFGAIAAPEELFGEGTSRFGLLTLDVRASAAFRAWGIPGQYSSYLRIQDNTTPLTPQDRMAIGGRYSVRGMDGESSLVGERGWTIRNDWSLSLGQSGQAMFFGLDAGEVGGPSTQNLLGNTLCGAVLGLRGALGSERRNWQYEVFAGGPVCRPEGFGTAEITTGFTMTLSW